METGLKQSQHMMRKAYAKTSDAQNLTFARRLCLPEIIFSRPTQPKLDSPVKEPIQSWRT